MVQSQIVGATESVNIEWVVSNLPSQSNNMIEQEWSTSQYEMLLIVPPEQDFIQAAEEFAAWKTNIGIPTLVLSNYSSYPGIDTPEKIRNMIIDFYTNHPIEWVLLMGDTDKIPIRYIYNPDGLQLGTSEPLGSSTLKPTDFYYAELTANWDIDGDGFWGEDSKYNSASDQMEMDFYPEVYVGRFPAKNIGELNGMINKTLFYEQALNAGDWMNRFLAVSGISDRPYYKDTDGEFEYFLNQYIIDTYVKNYMNWGHIYEYDGYPQVPAPVGPKQQTLTRTNMRAHLNQGCSIAVWAGHGAPSDFSALTVTAALNTADLPLLTNTNMFPLLIGDACSTNPYDYDGSLGESFFKQAVTGGIGYIGSMRISWYYPNDTKLEQLNRGVTRLFFHEMFGKGSYQQGKALYESKRSYANSPWVQSLGPNFPYWETERKIITSYMLLGDPTVHIYTDVPRTFQPLEFETTTTFEGSKRLIQILSSDNEPVPFTKITIYSSDEKYHTFTTDSLGRAIIHFPPGVRTYNYTLFAYNMIYRNGTFNVLEDPLSPQILSGPSIMPKNPTVSVNPLIEASLFDNESGISDAFVVVSPNHFQSFEYFLLAENDYQYSCQISKLDYGTYEYGVVVFDRAGNWNTTLTIALLQSFTVPIPIQLYGLIGFNMVVGVVVLVGGVVRGKKKYDEAILGVSETVNLTPLPLA
jgi:hypothetical protein